MVDYRRRVVDTELDELLDDLPAIAVAGPRGVGKTATAQRRARTVFALDDRGERDLLAVDVQRLRSAEPPVLVDEWQRLPETWDVVRRGVDAGAEPGRFLLTGSAEPTTLPVHSGAGRIVTVRMRPLSLAERGLGEPSVSLARLLDGRRPAVDGETTVTLADYVDEIVRSGLPGVRQRGERARTAWLDSYLDRVVERDFPEQGHLVRRPTTLRSWLAAYAAATASTASYTSILDAATPGEASKPARTTTIAYRDVLSQLWLLDPVPPWSPIDNHFARLAGVPKHHLADPALAARLLGLDATSLLEPAAGRPGVPRAQVLGALFESLVTLCVRVYAQHSMATVGHLRTRNGDHEVDLVVQGRRRRVVAIEVKLSPVVEDRDVRHLRWLADRLGDALLDAVVVTTGRYAYRRRDGIAVVPAALLGP